MKIKHAVIGIVAALGLCACNEDIANTPNSRISEPPINQRLARNVKIYELPGQYSNVIEYDTEGGLRCVQSYTNDVLSCVVKPQE